MPITELSSAERLHRALTGQDVDRLPFAPFLAYVWESYPKAVQDAGRLAFHHRTGCDPLWRGAPCPVTAVLPKTVTITKREDSKHVWTETETPVGTLRQMSLKSAVGNTNFLSEHPLKTAEDIKIKLWIEEHTRFGLDPTEMDAHFRGEGSEGLSIGMLIPRMKSALQSLVEHDMGTEELIYALADMPELVEALWRQMVANDVAAARLAVESRYEFFLTWEDSGTQNYSPKLYDRYIGTEIGEWCRILETSGKHYMQHACGHVRDLVMPMKAHRAYGIESISPPPTGNISIAEARALCGPDFAIIGGIEPTQFLHLTMDELGPYTERVISEGLPGKFILANSDSCPPGVTEAKFRHVADVVRGWRF